MIPDRSKEKETKYFELVHKFKDFSFQDSGLLNPYNIDFPEKNLWRKHNKLNPWELWHGNLNADILFIGQDFSNDKYFKENFKNNWDNERKSPTNKSLSELFSILGYNIGLPGTATENSLPLYFTNAVLGIKQNGMASPIKTSGYDKTSKEFTKKLIEIVNPKNIIVMGRHAYNMICKAYDMIPENPLSEAINKNGNHIDNNKQLNDKQLFVVAHCSGLGKVNRNFQQQKKDWDKINTHLSRTFS